MLAMKEGPEGAQLKSQHPKRPRSDSDYTTSCVDGFSRRILWLEVQRSNKNPRVVASYFIAHSKQHEDALCVYILTLALKTVWLLEYSVI